LYTPKPTINSNFSASSLKKVHTYQSLLQLVRDLLSLYLPPLLNLSSQPAVPSSKHTNELINNSLQGVLQNLSYLLSEPMPISVEASKKLIILFLVNGLKLLIIIYCYCLENSRKYIDSTLIDNLRRNFGYGQLNYYVLIYFIFIRTDRPMLYNLSCVLWKYCYQYGSADIQEYMK
jgi:hypothetical protein